MRYTKDHVSTFDWVKYRKERREKLAEAGLCTRCKKPRVKGKKDCQKCIEETKERVKQRREECQRLGKCICCDNPSRSDALRCAACTLQLNKTSRNRQKEIKATVLTHYGKGKKLQCCWPECKIDDLDILTLDHIENDGAKHRKEYSKTGRGGGTQLYDLLIRNGFPKGFQTLCFNHNMKKYRVSLKREGI